jgi:hypothetical protein
MARFIPRAIASDARRVFYRSSPSRSRASTRSSSS